MNSIEPSISTLHLAVDYGACTTTAVVAVPGSAPVVVPFDGRSALPSGVQVEPDGTLIAGVSHPPGSAERWVATPARLLHRTTVTVGDRQVPVLALVAATLSRVQAATAAFTGRIPDRVTLVVPEGWGPRRRQLLREAAHQVGWPHPELMPTPVAVARLVQAAAPAPPGMGVVVCDVGGGCEVSVLQHIGTGVQVLSCITDPNAGGLAVDIALTEYLCDTAAACTAPGRQSAHPECQYRSGGEHAASPHRNEVDPVGGMDPTMVLAAARTAKEALSAMDRVAVLMPAPAPPLTLDRPRLSAVAAPVLDAVVAAVRQALTAANLPAGTPLRLVLVGGATQLPTLQPVVQAQLGLVATTLPQPQLAAATGAVLEPPAPGAVADLAPNPPPAEEPQLRDVVAVAAPLVAAIAMLAMLLAAATAQINANSWPAGVLPPSVGALLAAIGLVCGMVTTAGVFLLPTPNIGRPDRASHPHPAEPHARTDWFGHWLRRALPSAATLSCGTAAAVAVVLAAATGVPTVPALTWALLAVLPTAAASTIVGVLAARWARPPAGTSWTAWMRLPLPAIVLTPAGLILTQLSTVDMMLLNPAEQRVAAQLGAVLLAAGLAFAVTARTRSGIAALTPFTVVVLVLVNTRSITTLTTISALALAVPWIRRAVHLTRRPPPPTTPTLASPASEARRHDWTVHGHL